MFPITVEPVLKGHDMYPISQTNMASQDRWSLVTGSFAWKCGPFARNMWSFKTGSLLYGSGLSRQVSVYQCVGILTLLCRPDFVACWPRCRNSTYWAPGRCSDPCCQSLWGPRSSTNQNCPVWTARGHMYRFQSYRCMAGLL